MSRKRVAVVRKGKEIGMKREGWVAARVIVWESR